MSEPPSPASYKKEFVNLIKSVRPHENLYTLFADWLELACLTEQQIPYHVGFLAQDDIYEEREKKYLEIAGRYSRDELNKFAKLLGIVKTALHHTPQDFLGQIYMELELSQDRNGEFFTPYNVSYMMAKMQLEDIDQYIENKGFITLNEPACGAGGMIIAAAQILEEAGYDPTNTMYFEATDINRICSNMAYLQTSSLGLSGAVHHGDTLRMEHWEGHYTASCHLNPQRTRQFVQSLNSEEGQSVTISPDNDTSFEENNVGSEANDNNVSKLEAKRQKRHEDDSYIQGSLFVKDDVTSDEHDSAVSRLERERQKRLDDGPYVQGGLFQ